MTDEYISRCGWWSVDTKPFSTVCGMGTEYRNGKCENTADISFTNAIVKLLPGKTIESKNSSITCSACGEGTILRDGKCVSAIDHVECGPHTTLSHGKCVIDYGDKVDTSLNFGPIMGQYEASYAWDMRHLEKIPESITFSTKANIHGTFEDTAAGVLMRKPQLRFLPLDKRAHLYNCFYHASKGKKEGLLNDSIGKADPNAILNDLYDALDGTNNRFFQDIYGHNGVFTYCLRGHG